MVKGQVTIYLNKGIFQTFIAELDVWKSKNVIRVPKLYTDNSYGVIGEYILPIVVIEEKYNKLTLECYAPEWLYQEINEKNQQVAREI